MGERPLFFTQQIVEKMIFFADKRNKTPEDCTLRKQMSVAIIGPNYSDDLATMEREVQRLGITLKPGESEEDLLPLRDWAKAWKSERVSIISPSATNYQVATETSEAKEGSAGDGVKKGDGANAKPGPSVDSQQNSLAAANFVLERRIGSDQSLTDVLNDELKKRWLHGTDAIHFVELGMSSPAGLSRSLEEQTDQGSQNEKDKGVGTQATVHSSDSRKPGRSDPVSSSGSAGARVVFNSLMENFRPGKTIVIPVLNQIGGGENLDKREDVTDYFERTLGELVSYKVKGGYEKFKVVGVFANNVEDKLAILKATKPLFPNATFLTTDMQAAYLEPENIPFTRNLLIASHYGLSVMSGKKDVANNQFGLKYRDAYQVSLYLSVESALDRMSLEPEEWGTHYQLPEPTIFEIGQFYEVPYQSKQAEDEKIINLFVGFQNLLFSVVALILGAFALSMMIPFLRPVRGWFLPEKARSDESVSFLHSIAPEIFCSVAATLFFVLFYCLWGNHLVALVWVLVLGGAFMHCC